VSDITLTIPLELTAAQIIRLGAKPTAVDEVDEARARELAIELHRLLAACRRMKHRGRCASPAFPSPPWISSMRCDATRSAFCRGTRTRRLRRRIGYSRCSTITTEVSATVISGCVGRLIHRSFRSPTGTTGRNCTDSRAASGSATGPRRASLP
jgi:hypothetical protein